jgi:Ser/Thr protein kinase RdoA (MazF antagonist)
VQLPYEESRGLYLSGLRETLLAAHDCSFPEVCAAFRDAVGLLDAAMERVDAAFAAAQPTVGIVHNDFHTNNGLYLADGSFSGFLDMDQVGVGPLVWDIGNTIFSFASNALGSAAPERLPELTAAFLAGYHRENPLAVEDYLLIVPAGLRWDLMRILRSLRRHRFENDRFPGNIKKIKDRLIERVSRFPEILGFIDRGWLGSVLRT